MPIEDRNRYSNLILMCGIHHTIIDDQVANWPVERLQQLKKDHEDWVEQALGLDADKLRDDTIYADYIDRWEKLAHLDAWHGWSSFVLGSGQPRLRVQVDQDLATLRNWLLSRVWPGRYPALEAAFHNFGLVLQDFHEKIREHLEDSPHGDLIFTNKFYQIVEWNPERYARLSAEYEYHVDIVSDLMLELTRAANLVCDEVRRYISHAYRLEEGRLMVQRGPDMNLAFLDFVPQYSVEERALTPPYPGFVEFHDAREGRDWRIGAGQPPG